MEEQLYFIIGQLYVEHFRLRHAADAQRKQITALNQQVEELSGKSGQRKPAPPTQPEEKGHES